MLRTPEEVSLVRQEVLDAQSHRLHGEVILQQSLPTKFVTAAILLVVIAASVWAIMSRYARVETARGILVPTGGYSKIYALRPGVVAALMVRDGDEVAVGQKLAVIRIEMPNGTGASGTESELGSIDNQTVLAKQQIQFAGQRSESEFARLGGVIDGLNRQAITLRSQFKFQEQIVSSMSETLAHIVPVVEKGFISKIEYERRRQLLLSAQEDLSRIQQQADATNSEIAKTKKEQAQAGIAGKNDQANVLSSLENFRQQRSRVEGQASYSLVAPVAGRVTAIQATVGRAVEGSMPVMVVIPERTALRADIFVPTRAIGFIRSGQEVRLLYDAFPYQRFGSYVAHVDTVSHLAVAGQETDAPFKIDEPVYRVTATLERQNINAYGKGTALQPGMTLVANVVLERQSFLDWFLEPLRAVSKRI